MQQEELENNNIISEEIEETPAVSEIDIDEIAKKYAENIRVYLKELKDRGENIHFENINPSELTYDDLIVADKLRKGELTNKEFEEYKKSLQPHYDKLRAEKSATDYHHNDSRCNFEAWVNNEMLKLAYQKKHPEKFH